jgi:hypothetical protein
MDLFVSDNITTLGTALILSIAIFGAVRAGQVMERNTILKHLRELDLEKLKQKTQSKLEVLWRDYNDTRGQLPEELDFKHIVENGFIIDESLQEQIIGLNKIYLDLISHGTDSSYFIEILNTYGPFVGM